MMIFEKRAFISGIEQRREPNFVKYSKWGVCSGASHNKVTTVTRNNENNRNNKK